MAGSPMPARFRRGPVGMRGQTAAIVVLGLFGAGLAACGTESEPDLQQSSPAQALQAELLQRYQTQFPYPTALWAGIGSGTPARKQWAQRERELLSQVGQADQGLVHTELGELYTRVEEHARGMAFLVRALQTDASNGRAWLWLGVNRLSVGQLDEAERLMDQADELLTENADQARFRGDLHFRQGALPEAEAAFAKAIELDPNQIDARLRLGALLEERDALSEAQAQLERVLELRPDNLEALYRLARMARNLGREEEAERYTSKHARATILDDWGYLTSGVPDYECSSALGIYYLERGRVLHALEEFERSLQTAPPTSAPRFNAMLGRVRCAIAMKQFAQAVSAMDAFEKEYPEHVVLEELQHQIDALGAELEKP